jgi:hypothetical protein
MSKAATAIFLALLSGCATIRPESPPILSPFGDGTQWIVLENLDFIIQLDDKSAATMRVPKGFVTDLASTPREIWSLYPPFGKYLTASILHDYLYWRRTCTRKQADKILYQTMRDAGVDQETQSRFYVALELAGDKAWKTNEVEKASGLVRVIPEQYLRRSPVTTWDSYRMTLLKQKVAELEVASDQSLPQVCAALGNEIKVKTGIMAIILGK